MLKDEAFTKKEFICEVLLLVFGGDFLRRQRGQLDSFPGRVRD